MNTWRVTFSDGNQRLFAAMSAKDVAEYLEEEAAVRRVHNNRFRELGLSYLCTMDVSYSSPEDVVSIERVDEEGNR